MIRRLAVSTLGSAPVWALLRRLRRQPDALTILCYHTLGPDQDGIEGWTTLRESDFLAQLADLQAHYDIVGLEDGLAGAPGSARPRAVVTFDDGDRGLYHHLLPILRKNPFPVTLYIATAQFETGKAFWFDRVVNALQSPTDVVVPGLGRRTVPGGGGKIHWQAIQPILEALKQAPQEARDDLADQIVAQGAPPATPGLGPMSRDQLKEIADTPGVTIGAHSHGHELLDQLPLEKATASMARSRDLLKDWTGQAVRHFAFPNGNHTGPLRAAAKSLGFASATVLEDRIAPRGADSFALPRISVGRYDSRARVRLRLVGL